MPTSPTICRTRISSSCARPASSTSCRRPTRNGIQYIGMNVKNPPFDNLKVRQAVAYAIPYQKIMDAVLFGLAKPMFGAPPTQATEVAWPQAHKYNTDIAKAKQLLAEAGYPERLRDHALVRPRLRRRQRADLRADPGEPGADRHQDHDQQDPGRQLAHRAQQEGDAALHQRVLRLARLPGVLLHLVLSRQEFDLQHHELPVAGHGRDDRRGRRRCRHQRQDRLRQGRGRLRRPRVRRHPAHPAVPALRQRRDAEERSAATSTGSTAGSTTARW